MATKDEKSEATRARIIEAARGIFAESGFTAAPQSEIVAAADVTTGAIYHHFGDKKGLFRAVAENVEQEILDYVLARLGAVRFDAATLIRGVELTLEKCAAPDIQRIVFRDAPTLFGHREWREVEINYAFGLMASALVAMAESGVYDIRNPQLTAQVILGNVVELAHAVAEAEDKAAALTEAKRIMRAILGALLYRAGDGE